MTCQLGLFVLFLQATRSFGQCPPTTADNGACETLQKNAKIQNLWAVDFYKAAISSPSVTPTTNLIVTPSSLGTALLASCAASTGVTQSEIKKALHYEGDCWEGANITLSYIERDNAHTTGDPEDAEFDDVTKFANGLFVDKSVKVKPEFAAKAKTAWGQAPVAVDFANNPEKARMDINKWVSEITNGTVKDLLPKGSTASTSKFMIVNAFYVLFHWAIQFDPKMNSQETFASADGSQSTVTFMNLKSKTMRYLDNLKGDQIPGVPPFQLLILGDRWGARSFMIFLPKDVNGLPALESALTEAVINQAADKAKRTLVDVAVPKFSIKSATNVKETLQKMGVRKLFSAQAELENIFEKSVPLDSLVHQVSLVFQEKGVEAAGGSAMTTGTRTDSKEKPVQFRANHPFFFVKRVENIQNFSDMGRVVKL